MNKHEKFTPYVDTARAVFELSELYPLTEKLFAICGDFAKSSIYKGAIKFTIIQGVAVFTVFDGKRAFAYDLGPMKGMQSHDLAPDYTFWVDAVILRNIIAVINKTIGDGVCVAFSKDQGCLQISLGKLKYRLKEVDICKEAKVAYNPDNNITLSNCFTMEESVLLGMLNRTKPFMTHRNYTNGLHLRARGDKILCVGCTGAILSYSMDDLPLGAEGLDFFMPTKLVEQLCRILDKKSNMPVNVAFDDDQNHIEFTTMNDSVSECRAYEDHKKATYDELIDCEVDPFAKVVSGDLFVAAGVIKAQRPLGKIDMDKHGVDFRFDGEGISMVMQQRRKKYQRKGNLFTGTNADVPCDPLGDSGFEFRIDSNHLAAVAGLNKKASLELSGTAGKVVHLAGRFADDENTGYVIMNQAA